MPGAYSPTGGSELASAPSSLPYSCKGVITGKLRETLRASGTKNDRWDCRLQAELVKHFHHLGSAIASADHVLPEELGPGLASLVRSLPSHKDLAVPFCSVFANNILALSG
jgi:hypothetical protein